MKLHFDSDWLRKMADLEEGLEVGAGFAIADLTDEQRKAFFERMKTANELREGEDGLSET